MLLPNWRRRIVRGGNNGVAYSWQEKTALRKIRESCEGKKAACDVLAIYLALTEIASDRKTDRFIVDQLYLSEKAGMSLSTLKRHLPDLVSIGVVTITQNRKGIKTQSTYELNLIGTGIKSKKTIAQSELTIAHNEPTIAQKGGVIWTTPEEYKEEGGEHSPKKTVDFESWRADL